MTNEVSILIENFPFETTELRTKKSIVHDNAKYITLVVNSTWISFDFRIYSIIYQDVCDLFRETNVYHLESLTRNISTQISKRFICSLQRFSHWHIQFNGTFSLSIAYVRMSNTNRISSKTSCSLFNSESFKLNMCLSMNIRKTQASIANIAPV
jgi:hypothetical protein